MAVTDRESNTKDGGDSIHFNIPREHAGVLLDGLRQTLSMPGMQANQQLKGWVESDLIRPLENAARDQSGQSGGTRSSTR